MTDKLSKMNRCPQETNIPEWMTKGMTNPIQKIAQSAGAVYYTDSTSTEE